ncbi:MAG: rhodanese-like domain-containing protein [Mycobacterium sp.]|nr:rhodanese-like domain-containing protein [Mycobacterium sp.]
MTINVHVPFEGDIAGTDMSIPFDQVQAQAAQLPQQRNTQLAVYCRSGRMSSVAVDTLSRLGYTDIVELAGGMQAWESAGRPLVGR